MNPERRDDTERTRSFAQRVVIAVAITGLFVLTALLLWSAAQIFFLAFLGILLAIIFGAPAHALAARTAIPRGVALALVISGYVLLLAAIGWLFGAQLERQISQLIDQFPEFIEQVRVFVRDLPGGEWILQNVTGEGGPTGQEFNVVSRITGTASLLWDVAAKVVFVVFLGIFLAASPHTYREGTVRLVPIAYRTRAREIFDELGHTLRGWLLGQLISMAIIGTLVTVGLTIIGLPLALALGILAALFEFIPIVGPFLAYLPAAFLAMSQGMTTFLWVTALYLLIQQLEGNVIQPIVQRRAVELPPALTVSAVLIAGAAFGPVGILVATPLMAVLLVLVQEIYLRDVLGDESFRK